MTVVIALMLASVPTGDPPAQPVLDEVFAHNRSIETLHVRFESSDWIVTGDEGEFRQRKWTAEYWYEAPSSFRILYQEVHSETGVTIGPEVDVIGEDGSVTVKEKSPDWPQPKVSMSSDNTNRVDAAPFPGFFLQQKNLHWWQTLVVPGSWKLTHEGDHEWILHGDMEGDRGKHFWTVDPARGFAITHIRYEFNVDPIQSTTTLELDLAEAAPGIWIPKSGVRRTVFDGDRLTNEVRYRQIPESLEVNQKLPSGLFNAALTDGTVVRDMNAKRIYTVGGQQIDEDRLKEILELADEAATDPQPADGAITARSSSWADSLWWITSGSSLIVLVAALLWRRRAAA